MAKSGSKKKQKRKQQSKSSPQSQSQPTGIDSVGWRFWSICFFVLLGPATYVGWNFAYEDRKTGIFPWVVGFGLAAFGAGLLSVTVNFAIQKRLESKRKNASKKK